MEEVLKPYLIEQGVSSVKSVLVTTNKKKNARGGLVAYQHAFDDLSILMKSNRDGEYEKHVFTTMFDLYALPNDFPGYSEANSIGDRYERVLSFEKAFSKAVASEGLSRTYSCMSTRLLSFVVWIICCRCTRGVRKVLKNLSWI